MDRIVRGGRRDVKMQTTFSWSCTEQTHDQFQQFHLGPGRSDDF